LYRKAANYFKSKPIFAAELLTDKQVP